MTTHSHRSLPPLVEGDIYGLLKVTIDEVVWCGSYPNDFYVSMKWWGEIDAISLRPNDVSIYPESIKEHCSVLYNIHTNFHLFETYLKQCNKLKLLLINNETKEIVGHIDINHLVDLITGIQYKKYFPIVTSSGIRIGDLRVDFELTMNSVPEEITSKKMRKRSRRKNKNNQSSFRTVDDEKPKQIQSKRGCKACSENVKTANRSTIAENKLNLEPLNSPIVCKVPPNTQRSEASDCALWEVLDKSKKLRDAMVLSVLEEDSSDFTEKLLLYPEIESNKTVYEPLKVKKNGEVVSFNEEKLISEYLEGKAMKEEEEIIVLNALHDTELKTNDGGKQKDVCRHVSKNKCLQSASSVKSDPDTEHGTSTTLNANSHIETEMNKLLDRVNCFRLTIDSLTLTRAGWKKINQCLDNKAKNYEDPPPGATYFVECHFVEDSPRSVTQLWKTTPLRFCSRRQIENVVYFGQSCAQSLRPQGHIATELAAASCVVCWRHLHQRVPSRLGSFSLAEVLLPTEACLQTSATLPVLDNNATVAHLRLSLSLGRDKLFYGEDLLKVLQDVKTTSIKTMSVNKKVQIDNVPLRVTDLSDNSKPHSGEVTHVSQTQKNGKFNSDSQKRNFVFPVCTNCSQILALSGNSSSDTSLCTSCIQLLAPHQNLSAESNLTLHIPTNFTSTDQRHHEYLIGIDSVIGFPLFAGIQEEISCYVDYKFPEITAGLRVVMSQRETTSRVVVCEPKVSVSSVHRHYLPLPVALPLSPLLAACSPGITLRLWLRYYQPSPRDHMVAMALLPMDELCLLELEFDQAQEKSAVTKVLELPLALVPSSVTAPYQQYNNLGVLRVMVTYSNVIITQQDQAERKVSRQCTKSTQYKEFCSQEDVPRKIQTASNIDQSQHQPEAYKREVFPIDNLLDQITGTTYKDLKATKNRFWTGPFGNAAEPKSKIKVDNEPNCFEENNLLQSNKSSRDPPKDIPTNKKEQEIDQYSRPVMKEDFDILAESLEQRFNQLQSDLLKKRQHDLSNAAADIENLSSLMNNVNEDLLGFKSYSSNNSLESLPFIVGPPADFKDTQNTLDFSQTKRPLSETQSDISDSDTISGFLKEEKTVANLGSNETFEREERKFKSVEAKTFKAKIKIDRAVNMKAVKGPSNGKKGKIPPSTWVSFGIGDCCEQNCGVGELVCTGIRYNTPVVRRNYNPVWNLAWDVDLPVDYLQQVNKRLVFRVFEENLDSAFGFASANVSILTSGLPCLSSWLSINDLAGACKGQIKIVVTPLEDVSKYQECSVFDNEEDEFEEFHKDKSEHNSASELGKGEVASFVASQTEVFVIKSESEASNKLDKEVEQLMLPSEKTSAENGFESEDLFSADDVINDYKNTLENNFRNEMAGLENLIKFFRVGSVSNELSFLRSTENKENLSSNPSSYQPNPDLKVTPSPLINQSISVGNELSGQSELRDKVLIDTSTETKDKPVPNHSQSNGEDIITKLLQQISMFQLPTVKISDSTSQTVHPETKETFTETTGENHDPVIAAVDVTVHMIDASTQTDDVSENQSSQLDSSPHVCGEIGSVLLQHFLTCKPSAIKVSDSSSQTECETTNSSGVFMSSCMSSGILRDYLPNREDLPPNVAASWMYSDVAQSNCERLIKIDNNIKDLERFLKENLISTDRNDLPPLDSMEGSSLGSLNGVIDSVQASFKQESRSSSDVESLGSDSQLRVVPRETPDGGNMSTVTDTNNTGTILRRQGTFVIEKPNSCTKEILINKESGDNHTA